jgi:L-threonylcarbamoyladenylate synthase
MSINVLTANRGNVARAADYLRRGGLVAFPTETVYGLGADATNAVAVTAIFSAKGRPVFNPLIVHVEDLAAAERLAVVTKSARRLACALWPGPLTLVLEKRAGCPIVGLATAGLGTVALRAPSHPIALALLGAAGVPIAAPSANRSGHVSATRAAHVTADLNNERVMVLDGGATPLGVESTIIDAIGASPVLLRPGAVTRANIERVLGAALATPPEATDKPTSPGQLASHYAPAAKIRLNVRSPKPGEALLAFGAPIPTHDGTTINLSPAGDLTEAAANLFTALRALDASGAGTIAVMPIPDRGLGEAINDRLRRAAAPRKALG